SLADPLRVLRLHCLDTEVLAAADGAGRPLAFALADGVLRLTLAEPLARGAESEATIRYRSRPKHGLYFHAPTPAYPGTPLEMYSQGQGSDNRRWFPCYDLPDDRATVEVIATVPEALRTVGNGVLAGSRPAGPGLREDTWRLDRPVPAYLVSLIAGRYETATTRVGDVPLEVHAPPGRLDEARNGCENTAKMMEFFNAYTGVPYPYPRYAQTLVWDFVYGGMENASATTMNYRLMHPLDARPNYSGDGLVAHELAHQWFGDLLTCRTWDDIWLNEGFATYFTDLFVEHFEGADEFAIDRRRQNRGYMDGTPQPEDLKLVPAPRGDRPLELFGGKQYSRGAAILHQLRIEIGPDAFREGIRRYCRAHADSAVTSEDLRRAMEGAAGRDLRWFFDQWVYGAGYPAIRATLDAPAGKPARLVLEQVQEPGGGQAAAFRITVPIRAVARDRVHRADLVLRMRKQEFEIPLEAPEVVRLGDGGGLFARVNFEQDAAAWARCLRMDTDVAGRMDAVEGLAAAPGDPGPEIARALAEDPCWAVREIAARCLAGVPGPASLGALLTAAGSDPDARVREEALKSLAGRTRDEAAAAARKAMESDSSPYVRAAAARAYGKFHGEGAFEALSALLEMESHRDCVRAGALDGLRALGDRRALDLARVHLRYDTPRGDQHQRREAALGVLLGIAPDDAATHATVVGLLDDPWHRMRSAAADAAGNYGMRTAEPTLRRMVESEPFDGAKAAAKAALEKIAPSKK
ncbi:MAG TPA: M1 family aminopeptidase, partial [Planctomycetota bacterium]|nr:M1 family aminopeptidase [Planctomycetota bacterium]